MLTKKNYQLYALSFYLIILLGLTLYALKLTNGHLIYTIDDPYIHLAVAENILRGGYGVNFPEYSSPCSSIIFPFLLVVTSYLGLGEWGPLILNSLGMALATWLAAGFFWKYAVMPQQRAYRWLFVITAPLIVLTLNAFGLVFAGLENVLSVLATVMVLVGLVRLTKHNKVSALLVIGILLLAITRFETIPFAIIAICVLLWQRHYIAGLFCSAAIIVFLLSYGVFMANLQLPFLPSSVLSKANFTSDATDHNLYKSIIAVFKNLNTNLKASWAGYFMLAAILLITAMLATFDARFNLSPRFRKGIYTVAAVSSLALVIHAVGGASGSFIGRYENYALVLMVLSLAYVYSTSLGLIKSHLVQIFMLPAILILLNFTSLKATFALPASSRNIYQQQYQMHRFVAEYFAYPVAVNDLGWVSYKNDNYVLDLVGLGSEKMRKMFHAKETTADDMNKAVKESNIVFAMVYDEWFMNVIPANWCPIAWLKTSKQSVSSDTVAFYLIDMSKEETMRHALSQFGQSLPPGATLTVSENCPRSK